jgi:hypothetical protein
MTKNAAIISATLVAALSFGICVTVGRQFPVHHYQRFGESNFLFDPATGKMCNPFRNPQVEASNTIDWAITGSVDKNGYPIVKTPPPPGFVLDRSLDTKVYKAQGHYPATLHAAMR